MFIYIKAYGCPLEAYSINFYYTQTYMSSLQYIEKKQSI